MKKNFITSDLHLCHSNIIEFCDRPYKPITEESTRQMNWDIVNSINEQIPDDKNTVLWNLGDLFYGKMFSELTFEQLKAYVDVMKGKYRTLKMIMGNHDRQFKAYANWDLLYPLTKDMHTNQIFEALGFDEVYKKPIIVGENIILSHEPVYLKGNQFINIHGHLHKEKVVRDYFCYDRKNYAAEVRKGIKPKMISGQRMVDPDRYINICWDAKDYKVVDFSTELALA